MEIAPEFACPLCLDLLLDPVSTPCKHNFCRSCIVRAFESGHISCPVCRAELKGFNPKASPPDADWAAKIDANVPQNVVAHRRAQAPRMLEVVVSSLHEEMPQRSDHRGTASKWTLWVALRGFATEHVATFIERVVYELGPNFRQRFVTAYPPFFSLCRGGWTPFIIRCQIPWNPMLAMPSTQVDHQLVFEQHGQQTIHMVEIDPFAMQMVELDVQKHIPNSTTQQQLVRRGPIVGVDPRAFSALGLEAPQQKAASKSTAYLPSSFTPPKPLPPKDRCFLEVVVGNQYKGVHEQTVGDLFFEWVVHVMLPEFQASKWRMIEYVVYSLHATGSSDIHVKRSPELELKCSSKEAHSVICTIHWNPSLGLEPTVVAHDLVFAEVGGRTSTTVGVSARRLHCFA
eukprot:CAMPEP_0172927714 /NCGR_PEP_ID=MMETSP1075-20121228/217607_1 /TAXON_ID=2916 /ORGANISM="Ceratium fusus, Strain PA161109" /LENGTH=399 /DNA_ID=CAMNT_0013788983 /DNA_START=71 /DNA_END=1270 /DNA_ORIENTATION=+